MAFFSIFTLMFSVYMRADHTIYCTHFVYVQNHLNTPISVIEYSTALEFIERNLRLIYFTFI